MKYLIVGDLHAGVQKNNPVFHRTLLKYGLWVKHIAEKNDVKHIIQLGDIFDNRFNISVETLNIVSKFFEIWKDFTIDITVGNHDNVYNDNSKINSLAPFKRHPNINIHETVTNRNGFVFTGWGVKLEDIPECDYLFGHYDTVGFELQKGKISTHGFKADEVMKKVNKMVFSGHYHRPQVKLYDKKPFYYSGSAYSLDWNDVDNSKYLYILDTDTHKVQLIENNVSPRFIHIRQDSDLNLVENNFVAIRYNHSDDGSEWKTKIQNLKPLGIKTELINEKVKQKKDESEIDEFKVVKIEDMIDPWVTSSIANLDDEELKKVAKLAKEKYISKR
jgi:DNA repair exonuclease SbcCD nuclease subunit